MTRGEDASLRFARFDDVLLRFCHREHLTVAQALQLPLALQSAAVRASWVIGDSYRSAWSMPSLKKAASGDSSGGASGGAVGEDIDGTAFDDARTASRANASLTHFLSAALDPNLEANLEPHRDPHPHPHPHPHPRFHPHVAAHPTPCSG